MPLQLFSRTLPAADRHRRTRHLRTYVLSGLLWAAIPSLVLLAVAGVIRGVSTAEREARESLQATALHLAIRLDDYLDKHLSAVRAFAATHSAPLDDSAGATRELRSLHSIHDGFITMLMADASGTVRAVSPKPGRTYRPSNVADREYHRHPISTGNPFVSDVFEGRGLGHDPIVALSAPLKDSRGRTAGVIEGSLNLHRFTALVPLAVNTDTQVLILDRQNRVVFSTRPGYRYLQSLTGGPLLAALSRSKGQPFHDDDGRTLTAYTRSANGWTVLTSEPLALVHREIGHVLGAASLWLAAVLLLCVILAHVTSRRVTRPLAALLERVRNLAPGEPAATVLADFSFAPAEIQELASSFDQMSAQLTASYQKLRSAKLDLEIRVEERTLELARANQTLKAEIAEKERTQALLVLRDRAMAVASEGITITDATEPGNPVVYANLGFEKTTGYSAEEIRGRGCEILNGAGTDPKAIQHIQSAVAEARECTVEVLRYRKNGSEFWERLSITPVRDDRGRLTNFICIHTDITHQKQVDKLKTELVSTVSHELRTPLTSIKGFAELLLEQDYPLERQAKFLRIILDESKRLSILIDDFLDLQRMEAGRETYHFAPVDIRTVVDGVVCALAGTTQGHRVRVEVPPLPRIEADEARLRQVFMNLLSNAIKFSPNGGDIVISARLNPGDVVFQVRDSGIGIAPESLVRLFRPFARLDNTDTRRIGGTGLGLALVKNIVEAHGGQAWVTSEVGCGSTFSFSLPLTGSSAGKNLQYSPALSGI